MTRNKRLLILCVLVILVPSRIGASSSSPSSPEAAAASSNVGGGDRGSAGPVAPRLRSTSALTSTSTLTSTSKHREIPVAAPSHPTTRVRCASDSSFYRAAPQRRTGGTGEEDGGGGGAARDGGRDDVSNDRSESEEEHTTGSVSPRFTSPLPPSPSAEIVAAAAGMAGTGVRGVGASFGFGPLLRETLRSSAGPFLRSAAFGAQLAVAYYVAKVSWTAAKEVWEELNEELSKSRGGVGASFGAGGSTAAGDDGREEQDMPYANEEAIDEVGTWGNDADDGEEEVGGGTMDGSEGHSVDSSPRSPQKSRRPRRRPPSLAAHDLAARLHSAGLPYASEAGGERTTTTTVEDVLRSLTRSEGNVLSQTLLSPLDGGLVAGGGKDDPSADAIAEAATEAWNTIGGLAGAKEALLDLAFPLLPPSPATRPPVEDGGGEVSGENVADDGYYGGLLSNPPGFMLYGPPGCGKTILVRALAATVGARFLVVSPSCLLRKYVGETNLNVRALFSAARKISPCVLFVDELDGLFRERGGEDHDVGRDLKTEFLQLWDGIRNGPHETVGGSLSSSPSVLVIGATNRPFDVDPAFLRRMPRRVFVGLPDQDAREAVLRSMLRRVPLDPNFDVALVARETDGYSPSDMREVLRAAALFPLREARSAAMSAAARVEGGGGDGTPVVPVKMRMPPLRRLTTEDVLRALERVKPTHFGERYRRALIEYVQNSGGSIDGAGNGGRGHPTPDGDYLSSFTSQNSGGETGNFFIADAGTFHGNDLDRQGNWAESESSSSDDGLSDDDDLDDF